MSKEKRTGRPEFWALRRAISGCDWFPVDHGYVKDAGLHQQRNSAATERPADGTPAPGGDERQRYMRKRGGFQRDQRGKQRTRENRKHADRERTVDDE